MKTEQKQIEEMTGIMTMLVDCDGGCMAQYCHLTDNYAKKLIEAGYGDVSEYKAEIERLTKILNNLTTSPKETDIFGKPKLLMFAGVTVEEAIKRVTEYDEYEAEIERLEKENTALAIIVQKADKEIEELRGQNIALQKNYDTLLQTNTRYYKKLEKQCAKTIKQEQIDALNKVKEHLYAIYITKSAPLGDITVEDIADDIDELIKEVEDAEDKG